MKRIGLSYLFVKIKGSFKVCKLFVTWNHKKEEIRCYFFFIHLFQ